MASAAANSALSLPFLRLDFDSWAPHCELTHGLGCIPIQLTESQRRLETIMGKVRKMEESGPMPERAERFHGSSPVL